ncbi:MAG TPA: DUF504 domain-containing protein [Rhodocyclaceae bacterium]|nr:DUF504 domain-containing protein [Rhodocyclaceae bacterium]
MTPLHDLLARIRWDPAFGRGRFEIAYWDRVEQALIRVDLREIHDDPESRFGFLLTDADGRVHWVPYHRVRQVWRDGAPIWQRAP